MNEFTKDELEIILSDMRQCDMEYSRSPEENAVLFKIQEMVKNICPHENTAISYGRQKREIYCMDCSNFLDEDDE